jgi:hypothetical protein
MHAPLLCRRRVVALAAVVVAAAVSCAPAAAQLVPTTLTVVGDSVIVAGQPFGRATVRVTRPDAVTGKPVVIGLYSGDANPSTPFTVNTTVPNAVSPGGDCWQSGALSQALTPDIRPGDTVTVAGDPSPFGGTPPSTSVTVPPDGPSGDGGPIPECRSIAPFAQNAVTAVPTSVTGGPIEVSGISQPLATGVSSSVSDGKRSTAPVEVTPNADGTWSSAISAAQVDPLANGSLAVQPVFAVPDVSTGATAHIAGAPISTQKEGSGQAGGDPATGPASRPGANVDGARGGVRPVSRLQVQSPISIVRARRDGLSPSFIVPQGARVIDVRLSLGKRTVLHRRARARNAGARQVIRLRGLALRRVLRPGRYTLAVRAGASRDRLGTAVLSTIRVR